MSLFIHNAEIYSGRKLIRANIVISDGKIEDITEDRVTCMDYLDAENCIVIPGMIEPDAKGELEATKEAVASGITTLVFNNKPKEAVSYTNYWWHKIIIEESELDDKTEDAATIRLQLSQFEKTRKEAVIRKALRNNKKVSVIMSGEDLTYAINTAKDGKGKIYISGLSNNTKQVKKSYKQKIFVEIKADAFERDETAEAVNKGIVDTISATDKESGFSSIPELILEKKITMCQAITLCCENPAKIFGIKKKGFIEHGFDADLIIMDKAGKIRTVLVNGKIAYDRGELNEPAGKQYKEEKDELSYEAKEREEPDMPGTGPNP